MQINGKNFKVYLSDSVDTIKDRIAASMNTLPQYLVFTPELESPSQTGALIVVNALDPVLNSKVYKFPEDKLDFNKVSREDAERFFIATHDITSAKMNESGMILFLTYNISGLTALNLREIWDNRADIRKKMRDKIAKLQQEVEETTVSFEAFENIPSIKTVEYEVSMVQFNIRFGKQSEAITVAELFNSLTVTKMAPYASTSSFYKIFHDFAPNPDWLELETPNVILVKVNGEVTTDLRQLKNQYKKYTDSAFAIIDNEIVGTLNMNVGHRNVSRRCLHR